MFVKEAFSTRNVFIDNSNVAEASEIELIEVKAEKPVTDSTDIKTLIRRSFPEVSDVAVAVAMGESRFNAKHVNNSPAKGKYKGECSVGLFQINLSSNGCNGNKWVHAANIPGNTIDEKIQWLQIPENNIKYAREIYKTGGWEQWGAYTNGAYKWFL